MSTQTVQNQNHQDSHQATNFVAQQATGGFTASGAAWGTAQPTPDRDALVLQHLPTVRIIARRIAGRLPQQIELDDLVSAGTVGLIDAASRFDFTKKVQFKTYAQFRIRGAILDSLRLLDWSPRELRRKGRLLSETVRNLSVELGRAPTNNEIAQEMGMELLTLQHLMGELRGLEVGSLHAERGEETGEEELDFLAAPDDEDPLSLYIEGQNRTQLAAALASLPEKERLVLTLYYFEELTLKEIGSTMSVVESRVSQIRSSALRRLRSMLDPEAGKGKGEKTGRAWN